MLDILHASKRFAAPEGGWITALDDVSLTVAPNEFLTLLGPSGCGKTTLLRAISGFEDLDSGDIRIDGASVAGLPAHRRPVNTVFQRYALFPHLSVARNVAYSLEIAGIDKPSINKRVGEMLELVGLDGYGARKIRQLSGGQQQRVALARSLVARPKILLLDEPLSALDKNLRQRMQFELKSIQSEIGIAFVFVTHDQEEALTMSDRIAVLGHGKIEQLGTPEDLYHRPISEFVARFLGEGNLFSGRIAEARDGQCRISLEGGHSVTVAGRDSPPGRAVTLLVRPEDVRLGTGEAGRDLALRGTVSQVFFVGSDYRVVVDAPGLPGIKATIRAGRGTHPAPGSEIDLCVAQDALHLVEGSRI
ncbi:MAG: ABC transporter ATP-binding protein [Alphaproteobacteria bacterium]